MSSFSIFKVPYLVQQLILGIAEPCELISISLCSKRVHFLVKSSYSRRFLEWRHSFVGGNILSEVQIWTPQGPRSMVKNKVFGVLSEEAEKKKAETRKLSDLKFEANSETHECQVALDEKGNLDTIWKDVELGKRMLPIFITELFNIEIDDAIVDGAGVAALKFLNNRQRNKIRRISCPVDTYKACTSGEMISGPHLQSLLTDHPTTRSLLIWAKTPENFRLPENLPPFKMMYFKHAPWITIEDIMKMDIEEITVGEDKISSLDFNRFLKHWLNGGSPKLKSLTVGLLNLDNNVFEDLEQITVFSNQPREIPVMDNQMIFRFPNGHDITRKDGRIISVINNIAGLHIMVLPKPEGEPELVAGIQAMD